MKAGFPLSAADVEAVLGALRVEATPTGGATYTFRDVLDDVVESPP